MAKQSAAAKDEAFLFIEGTLASAAAGTGLCAGAGKFNIHVWGTFVATWTVERSFDAGTTYVPLSKADGTANAFTGTASFVVEEPENGVIYRVRVSAYTSGTLNYRISR